MSKTNIFKNLFSIFLRGLKFFFEKSEKNIWIFCHLQSKILLKDYDFWQFSTPTGYLGRCGKMPNHSKIAPGGLCKWQNKFLPSKIFLEFDKTLTANNSHLKTATTKNYHIFGILSFHLVVPWMGYSISKFWENRVLVSLVFHVFSTVELTSPCKNLHKAINHSTITFFGGEGGAGG